MYLLDVKNYLVKISYNDEDKIALAQFIALVDSNKSYVAQIVNLKAEINTNYAIAKLIFTFNDEGIVDNYDGSIPSIKAQLSHLASEDILKLLPVEKPIAFGELAQQNTMLKVDQTIFEKNLTICAEKFDNINTIVKNSTDQLARYKEKVVVIDVDHTFGEFEPVRFKRDFKLPLNAKMIDYIYENDLTEVDATSKAVIQDIFYEVQQYTKNVEGNFIPFETFLNVVSQQYEQSNIPELALLKHKLLKYQQENVFAQSKEELDRFKEAIEENQISYVDIADVPDTLQKELISYIHGILNSFDTYIYMFVKLTNKNADKKLLMQILDNEHIFTTIICSHNYKYLPELKQRAENLIFFAPQTLQHDFASYNTLLNKLNSNEFIIYGELTQNVPFILELREFSQDKTEEIQEEMQEETHEQVFDNLQEENIVLEEEAAQNNTDDNTIYDFDATEDNELTEENLTAESLTEQEVSQNVTEEDPEQTDTLNHEDLVEQIAKDVDEVFYTKPQQAPTIEDITSPDTITEDDLDFIDDLSVEQPVLEKQQMEEEHPLENNDFEISNELPFEEEHPLEEQPEEIQEEILEEEPSFEDVQPEFETDNASGTDELIEEPQPPVVPIYPSDEPVLDTDAPAFEQGDMVSHPKYGKGVIEKLIKYGNKTLCSISFENVGRRLLDPAISELQKID